MLEDKQSLTLAFVFASQWVKTAPYTLQPFNLAVKYHVLRNPNGEGKEGVTERNSEFIERTKLEYYQSHIPSPPPLPCHATLQTILRIDP